jgi:hypothetical protein
MRLFHPSNPTNYDDFFKFLSSTGFFSIFLVDIFRVYDIIRLPYLESSYSKYTEYGVLSKQIIFDHFRREVEANGQPGQMPTGNFSCLID